MPHGWPLLTLRDVRNKKPAWHRWYKTARWARRRAAQLNAEPLCRRCARHGRTEPASVADHVTPHRGDPDLFWHGPLQSLCTHCHSGAKQSAERRGFSTEVGADGMPIDPAHPFYRKISK